MGLEFALTDFAGEPLSALTDRKVGAEVAGIGLGTLRTATVRASLEDEVASYAAAFETKLKVWLDGELILFGPALSPVFAGGAALRGGTGGSSGGGTVEISAINAEGRLDNAFTEGLVLTPNVDQAQIMATLMEHADTLRGAPDVPSHGLIQGSLPATVTRTRSYPDGKKIREAIVELSQVIGGVEFEFAPLDRSDGVFAELNTGAPRLGSDRSAAVILEYNVGRHTGAAFSWEPGAGEIFNRYLIAGEPDSSTNVADCWVAENIDSQRRFGLWAGFEVRPDITEIATLREHAEEVVSARAYPIDFFEITPVAEQGGTALAYYRSEFGELVAAPGEGFASPPRFGPGGDYWIGDDIGVIARELPGIDLELKARVTEAKVTEADPAGTVVAEISCVPYTTAANVTGFQDTVTLEERPYVRRGGIQTLVRRKRR